MKNLTGIHPVIERKGVVLSPSGDPTEAEGILNPANARDRNGRLLLYPRDVAAGNVSRVGLIAVTETDGAQQFQRLGFALEPEADYEFHGAVGHGCEDPRVTFIPVLDRYVMCYTAYGADGPRIALAVSVDGYKFERLGRVSFPAELNLFADDKDAAFFPEPVFSPKGVLSLAMYHRPMTHIPPVEEEGGGIIPATLAAPASSRQSIRIAYVPLTDVLRDLQNILTFRESALVMQPNDDWGCLKLGAGSAPVRIKEGWLSVFHGVDAVKHADGHFTVRYSAGLVVHDLMQPHKIRYRSSLPLLQPETEEELSGIVDNVVFPTALDPRPDLGARTFDVYYGMADYKIGLARLTLARRAG